MPVAFADQPPPLSLPSFNAHAQTPNYRIISRSYPSYDVIYEPVLYTGCSYVRAFLLYC